MLLEMTQSSSAGCIVLKCSPSRSRPTRTPELRLACEASASSHFSGTDGLVWLTSSKDGGTPSTPIVSLKNDRTARTRPVRAEPTILCRIHLDSYVAISSGQISPSINRQHESDSSLSDGTGRSAKISSKLRSLRSKASLFTERQRDGGSPYIALPIS